MAGVTDVPTAADLYAAGLERLLALAAELSDDEAARPVPACPGWTVKDVLAHQAGVLADVAEGLLEGAATDPWTARQVEERKDRTLAECATELAERGPGFVEFLRAAPFSPAVVDQWSHEQDIRGAVGKPGSRDVETVAWIVALMLDGRAEGWIADGRPAVRIVTDSGDRTLGDGEPAATLEASDFELARAFIGRRSQAQFEALGWTAGSDPAAVVAAIDNLHVFPLPERDLTE